MKRLAAASTAIPEGDCKDALVASAPSPEKPKLPFPATVEIRPLGVTLRIRLFPESAMNKLPALSTAMPAGQNREVPVAAPPSPEKELLPFPAMVEMIPPGVTMRIRLFEVSAIKRLPARSTATPRGWFKEAAAAGPLSPEKPPLSGKPITPFPANVEITPPGVILRIRLLRVSVDKQVAGGIQGYGIGGIQICFGGRPAVFG